MRAALSSLRRQHLFRPRSTTLLLPLSGTPLRYSPGMPRERWPGEHAAGQTAGKSISARACCPGPGIHVKRDNACPQPLCTLARSRCRDRGKASMWDKAVSKRSGNDRPKKRVAGVVPSIARQSKLCRIVHTLQRCLGNPRCLGCIWDK